MKPWLIPCLALAAATPALPAPLAAQDPPLPPDNVGSVGAEFDRSGGFVRSLTITGLASPRGVAVDDHGNLVVVSSGNGRVVVADLEGNLLRTVTHPDLGSGTGISRSPAGEWFVGNFSPGRVVVFDAAWNHLRTITATGMNGVNCVAFDPGGAFAVSAALSNEIFRFDAAGGYLGKLSHPSMLSPMSIALDSSGDRYVSGGGSGRVTKFDAGWNYLLDFGAAGLLAPQGVVVDEQDTLFVSDFSSDQIRVFDTAGNLLGDWLHLGLPLVRNFAFQTAPYALAREGAVARGGQPVAAPVLTVNGSSGDRLGRLDLLAGDALSVELAASPAGPAAAGFVLYAHLGAPGPGEVRALSNGGGLLAFPAPFHGGAPLVVMNSLGAPGLLGAGALPPVAAPATVLSLPNGLGRVGDFCLQAVLHDVGSPAGAASPYAATNAVTLRVR